MSTSEFSPVHNYDHLYLLLSTTEKSLHDSSMRQLTPYGVNAFKILLYAVTEANPIRFASNPEAIVDGIHNFFRFPSVPADCEDFRARNVALMFVIRLIRSRESLRTELLRGDFLNRINTENSFDPTPRRKFMEELIDACLNRNSTSEECSYLEQNELDSVHDSPAPHKKPYVYTSKSNVSTLCSKSVTRDFNTMDSFVHECIFSDRMIGFFANIKSKVFTDSAKAYLDTYGAPPSDPSSRATLTLAYYFLTQRLVYFVGVNHSELDLSSTDLKFALEAVRRFRTAPTREFAYVAQSSVRTCLSTQRDEFETALISKLQSLAEVGPVDVAQFKFKSATKEQ